MNQWLNRSHPQTLQAGVILGYISAVFGLLGGISALTLLLYIGMGVGAFATANNKRWGYILLAVAATLIALFQVIGVVFALVGFSTVVRVLILLNASVFPVALAAAVLHTQSRQYQKIWFE